MHPAASVIFFTTASGAGYGMLALLGLGAAFGVLPPHRLLGFVGLGLALALITAGLLSSTLHLGRPERAWRAFSQWRSSWLSREGVAAVATYVPAGILGIGWVLLGRTDGMIYASLKPIAQWHSGFTVPVYLILAFTSGGVLLNAMPHAFGMAPPGLVVAVAIAATWIVKALAWR